MKKHLTNSLCLLSCLIAFASTSYSIAQEVRVQSPQGNLEVVFNLRDGVPTYSLRYQGNELIGESRLGVSLADDVELGKGFEIVSTDTTPFQGTWTQPWGEQREILNSYNELRVKLRQQDSLGREMAIVFRVYDDGVGFRYEWPEQPHLSSLVIMDELTQFNLIDDCSAWWIPAYEKERYEYLYQNTPVSKIEKVHTPLTMTTPDGVYLSIHEAALVDFASMTLVRNGDHNLKADLVPWSDGVKVKADLPHHSPWRTIQVAKSAGDLITSYLILNLNEPSKLVDTSWIKPGKYVGIWWELHLGRTTWGSGEQHGATTENVECYIDFAAKHGFSGVLVEGWNQGWDGDWITHGDRFSYTEAYPDFDMEELANYAKEKNVSLIGHHETGGAVLNYESQLKDAMDLYQRFGYGGVKTGYVNYGQNIKRLDENGEVCREWHHGQFMVDHYHRVMKEAARHKLMVDVHEPIKDTGLRRTYPNMMTREGARGQEYDAWATDGGNPPDHTTILPFTRLLSGPMDYTPGVFDLLFEMDRPDNRVNSTLCKQLALYVVLYSPLQMVADLPENYEPFMDAFQFIVAVPTDWETTRVLNGAIGDFVTIVRKRRGGQDWYLGAITDENERTLDVPLTFLDPDRTYLATIYRDAEGADWKTAPSKYEIERVEVTAQTVLPIRLAAGGGQAISFEPQDSQRISQQSGTAVPKK